MSSLAGRVVLVTGASSGIGAATALALARAGVVVLAAARRTARLAEVAVAAGADGASIAPLALDVTDGEAVGDALARIEREHGRLDGLVNAAGLMDAGFVGVDAPRAWSKVMRTNLASLVHLTRCALPLLKRSGAGHIVNISSTASRRPNPGSSAYAAAKAGVNAFTQALRQELIPDGIRVTLVIPGLVATELFTHFSNPVTEERYRQRFGGMTPLHAGEVADAIVHALALPPNVSLSEVVIEPAKHPQ